MIKANEMRVGNYLRYYSYGNEDIPTEIIKYVKVIEIHDYPVIERDNGQRITLGNDIFKIPLTEEILLKCGFDNDNGNEDWSNYDGDEDKFVLCGGFIRGEFIYTAGEGIYLSKPIKYLHQLQNLYFVLSGEELEINL